MSQSVGRALDILIALQTGGQSLDELAEVVGVHKSTVLRLLQTMQAERFVMHDDRHRYALGSRLFELSNAALEGREVRATARRHLEALNATTGQTVHLADYEAGEVVYIDKLDAVHGVRMYSRIGLRAPLHCTAVAKVLIAALPGPAAAAVVDGIEFTPMTPATITGRDAYLEEIAGVRAAGYATDDEEHEAFVNCVAAPIRNGRGDVVAAVSVSVPTISLDREHVHALLPEVLSTADAVSRDLGWTPQPNRTIEQGAS